MRSDRMPPPCHKRPGMRRSGDGYDVRRSAGRAPDNAEERVIADRQEQTAGEALAGPSSQCQTEMMDNTLQPRRPSIERPGDCCFQPFREDLSGAIRWQAAEPPGRDTDLDRAPLGGQVRQNALISAVNARRHCSAARADRGRRDRPGDNDKLFRIRLDALNGQSARSKQIGRAHV